MSLSVEKFASEDQCCIWGIAIAIQLMTYQKNCIVLRIAMVPTFCIVSDLFFTLWHKAKFLCCSLLVCITRIAQRIFTPAKIKTDTESLGAFLWLLGT